MELLDDESTEVTPLSLEDNLLLDDTAVGDGAAKADGAEEVAAKENQLLEPSPPIDHQSLTQINSRADGRR